MPFRTKHDRPEHRQRTDGVRLGVDVGGTFTDLVALTDGRITTVKVPSTPQDQSVGVMNATRAAGIEAGSVSALAHGMTVATNALLERMGARTALITTAGFRDILEIGRQNRPSLYQLHVDRPPALVPRDLRFTVRERVGPHGVIDELADSEIERVVGELERAGVESVAVCLLFGYLFPEHERRLGRAVKAALPGVHVSLSTEVLPEFREFERFSTTAADAYLGPKIATYLGNLAKVMQSAGMPRPLVMQSSGGVVEIEAAVSRAASCLLSGPAGGVVGAAYVANASGYKDLLTFDMGGTSTDVAPIVDGRIETTTAAVVAGVPIKMPMVDVHTVSAGGGSVAWIDSGGALRVGPHSAGADPGPACYGRGGADATVTDANLFLGYLEDGARLGGELVLRRTAAAAALDRLGASAAMDSLSAAIGVVLVANAEMGRALRVISVERGLDPREFVLVAFGGAGPMHACALAEDLGTTTVLVPKASGVLSALGLAISDLRRDYVAPFLARLDDVTEKMIEDGFRDLEVAARRDLEDPDFTRRADLRYRGQSFELTVDADGPPLASGFQAAHRRRYGYVMEGASVEVVNLRVVATVPIGKPSIEEPPAEAAAPSGSRMANFDGEWKTVPVFDRTAMGAGTRLAGPALVEFPEATCVVRPGWNGAMDDAGTLVLERAGG
jgi:N-methylhydantoinase A